MSVNPAQHGANVPQLAIQTNPPDDQIHVPPGISTSPRVLKSGHGQETILVKVRPESSNLLSPPTTRDASRPSSGMTVVDEDYNHALHIFPEVIGRGKFGEVFRAQLDDTCGTVLAVKRVKISSAMPERTRVKCFNEVALLKSLSHPHIVGCLDAFFDPLAQELVIVLEMVPGGDLKDMVRTLAAKKRRFTEKRLWVTLRDLASALQYMHAKRILHRDLKSANVLMGKEGSVKLADFGLGRLVAGDGTLEAVSKVGTPLYMPPEILRGDKYGSKADVYSLGCIMYEMVRFATPFQHCTEQRMSMVQLFECIKAGAFAALVPAQCKYSSLLCDTIMAMLSSEPARRPSTRALLGLASVVAAQVSAGHAAPSATEAQVMVAAWERETREREEEEARQRASAEAELLALEQEAQLREQAEGAQSATEFLARSCGVRVLEGASAQRLHQSLRATGLGEGVVLVDQTATGAAARDGAVGAGPDGSAPTAGDAERYTGAGDGDPGYPGLGTGAFEEYYPVETGRVMAANVRNMHALALTPSFTPAQTPVATPAKRVTQPHLSPHAQPSPMAALPMPATHTHTPSPSPPAHGVARGTALEDNLLPRPNAYGAHEPRTQQPLAPPALPAHTDAQSRGAPANQARAVPLPAPLTVQTSGSSPPRLPPRTAAHTPTSHVRLAFASVDPSQPPTPAHAASAHAPAPVPSHTGAPAPVVTPARPPTRPRMGVATPTRSEPLHAQQQPKQASVVRTDDGSAPQPAAPVTATSYIRQILTARQAALSGSPSQVPALPASPPPGGARAAVDQHSSMARPPHAGGAGELPSTRTFVAVPEAKQHNEHSDSQFYSTPRKPSLHAPHNHASPASHSHPRAPAYSHASDIHQHQVAAPAPGLSHLNTALQRQTIAPLRLPASGAGQAGAMGLGSARTTGDAFVGDTRPHSSHLVGPAPGSSNADVPTGGQGQAAPSFPSLRVSLRHSLRLGDAAAGAGAAIVGYSGAMRTQAQSSVDAPTLATARPVPRVSQTPSRVNARSAPISHPYGAAGAQGTLPAANQSTMGPAAGAGDAGRYASGLGSGQGPVLPQGMLAPLQTPRQQRTPQPPATAPPLVRFSRRFRNPPQ